MQRRERIGLFLDVVATSAILAASATLIWTNLASGRAASAPAFAAQKVGETVPEIETTATPTTLTRGRAKIAIIEFSDFQCPFCAQYAQEVYPHLESEFIRPGLVNYVFRYFPLANHANAFAASEAAECAANHGQYLAMRSVLFANHPALTPPRLLDYAAAIGLNRKAFEQCLADGLGKAQVKADMAEGERLGVTSTPTFFVGTVQSNGTIRVFRRVRGSLPYHVIRAELQKLL